MSYKEIREAADSTPLADALTKIALMIDAGESDPEAMMDLLNEIDDVIAEARKAWMANIRAAQDAELVRLRALNNR